MTLRPLLLAFLLLALTGTAAVERAGATAAPTACAVSTPTAPDDDAPGIDDTGLAAAETPPGTLFGVEGRPAAAPVPRADAPARRPAPADTPPAADHGAPSPPPPEG